MLRLCDITRSEPGALRATRGHHESSVDGEPAMYRTLSQGCKGDSKCDEMHSPIPKGQVGRSKVYMLQKNRTEQRLSESECECAVWPLPLLCCMPLHLQHGQLKVPPWAPG